MTVPETMKAAVVTEAGCPFELLTLPTPTAGPGQVLVEIKASGVNPLDLKIRAGAAPHARHALPAILGLDAAGVVTAVGEGVADFTLGDEVFGMIGGVGGHQGSLAEYAAVDAALLARKPPGLSFVEAAAIPLVFITAWEGLVDRARITASHKVLIHGGAGGVGHMAIQIARAFGADVYATGAAGSAAQIAALGATPIDYAAETVEDYVARLTGGEGFDVVYDTVGGPVLDSAFKAIRRFGHVVSCLGWGSHSLAPLSFQAGTYSGVFTLLPLLAGIGREHHGAILREAAAMAVGGRLTVRLHPGVFGLETIEDAHGAASAGVGKVVVTVG